MWAGDASICEFQMKRFTITPTLIFATSLDKSLFRIGNCSSTHTPSIVIYISGVRTVFDNVMA